jgi:hypothetical protein
MLLAVLLALLGHAHAAIWSSPATLTTSKYFPTESQNIPATYDQYTSTIGYYFIVDIFWVPNCTANGYFALQDNRVVNATAPMIKACSPNLTNFYSAETVTVTLDSNSSTTKTFSTSAVLYYPSSSIVARMNNAGTAGVYLYWWVDDVCASVAQPSYNSCAASNCSYSPPSCSMTGSAFCYTKSFVNQSAYNCFNFSADTNGCPVYETLYTSSPTPAPNRRTYSSSSTSSFLGGFLGGFFGLCFLVIGIMCCVNRQFRHAFIRNNNCNCCAPRNGWVWAPQVINSNFPTNQPVYDQYGQPVRKPYGQPQQVAPYNPKPAPCGAPGVYTTPAPASFPPQPAVQMYAPQPPTVIPPPHYGQDQDVAPPSYDDVRPLQKMNTDGTPSAPDM